MHRIFAASVTAMLLVLPQSVGATTPGANGQIALEVGAGRLFTVDPDGNDASETVPQDGVEDTGRGHVSWSPDGTRLAFARSVGGNTDIYAMDADGGNVVRLTRHEATESYPTWSPNGSRLAFASDRSGAGHVYLMTSQGRLLRSVTKQFSTASKPAWNPTGRRIALCGRLHARGSEGLYSVRADGSRAKRLTRVAPCSLLSWAPGGRWIAYVAKAWDDPIALGAERIFIVRRDGSKTRMIPAPDGCDDECYLSGPAWSPDGTEMAFVMTTEIDLTSYLVAMALRSGAARMLFDEDAADGLFAPSWQAL